MPDVYIHNLKRIAKLLRDELYYEEAEQVEEVIGFLDISYVSVPSSEQQKSHETAKNHLIPSHYNDNDEDDIGLYFRDKD